MADRRDEAYLGDGVYAYHDGYQIWLRTARGAGYHDIALEPQVFAALVDYERKLREKYAAPWPRPKVQGMSWNDGGRDG